MELLGYGKYTSKTRLLAIKQMLDVLRTVQARRAPGGFRTLKLRP